MSGFILSPAAQTDVDHIWDYTAANWNIDQAERYIGDIRDTCRALAAGEKVSRAVDIREGYRKISVGSHILFFRITDAGLIFIVRILHQSMDANRHL